MGSKAKRKRRANRKRAPCKHGHCRRKRRTMTYISWLSMLARCYRPSHCSYAWYGRKGIGVCESWRHSFQAFVDDMGRRPSRRHTLGRLRHREDYGPGNCAWQTATQQQNALEEVPF